MRLHCLQWKGNREHEVRKLDEEATELLNKVEHNVGEEGKRDAVYYKMKMERDNFELDRNVHLENQNAFRTAMHEGIIEIKELQKMKKYNKRKEEKSNR